MKKIFFALAIVLCSLQVEAQTKKQIVSGPMLGPVELKDAKVWVEVSPDVKSVALQCYKKGVPASARTITYSGKLGQDFNPVQFLIGGLEINTSYDYRILINGKLTDKQGTFTTKDLWQYRKPPPEFSFLTGSCAYFNQPIYDRPGKPYGGDSSIFQTMAKENARFMLWMGDNWYTREVDYYSEWGLWYRASLDRAQPILQDFLKSTSHIAIWDDHDYGPNNSGKSYPLKEVSRKIFMNYWANPSHGENGEGIYSMMTYEDIDLFLLDNRWWRSADYFPDSVNGKPNPEKTMFGAKQMSWLKDAVVNSRAPFKIIVTGSQALNPVSPYEKWRDFSYEFNDFLNFLSDHKVNGVVFLNGDRHHSEIIKIDRAGTYPLYDITVSPLTAGTHGLNGPEANNPYRILTLFETQNYAKISFSGPRNSRVMKVSFFGVKGDPLGEWSIEEKVLRTPR